MIDKEKIIEYLTKYSSCHELENQLVIYEEDFDKIANEIMEEIKKGEK